jgi:hypothetical protein
MAHITVTLRPNTPPPPLSPSSSTGTTKVSFLLDKGGKEDSSQNESSHNETKQAKLKLVSNTRTAKKTTKIPSVLYIQIPSRPTECHLNALVSKLWGCWASCSILPLPDTRTANEKRYKYYVKKIGPDNGMLQWGHETIVEHFLPSLTEFNLTSGKTLCRASLAFDKNRKESKILLKNGLLLQLKVLEPSKMLKAREKEMELIAKAQELARKSGKTVKKIKVKGSTTTSPGDVTDLTTSSSSSVLSIKQGRRKKKLSADTIAKKKAMIEKQKEEEEKEEDEELLLLQEISMGTFGITIQLMVGGRQIHLDPIFTTRHIVADVSVMLQRKSGIQIKNQRMMYQGILLEMHSMLCTIGMSRYGTNDVIYLTVIGEKDLSADVEDGVQSNEMRQDLIVKSGGKW